VVALDDRNDRNICNGVAPLYEATRPGHRQTRNAARLFAPRDRSGGKSVAVSACCTDGTWTTANPAWRTGF
jgi:hypothetical protein